MIVLPNASVAVIFIMKLRWHPMSCMVFKRQHVLLLRAIIARNDCKDCKLQCPVTVLGRRVGSKPVA